MKNPSLDIFEASNEMWAVLTYVKFTVNIFYFIPGISISIKFLCKHYFILFLTNLSRQWKSMTETSKMCLQ